MSAARPGDREPKRPSPGNSDHSSRSSERVARRRVNPGLVVYLMGPTALATILFLRRLRLVADEPAWLWLVVFAVIFAFNAVFDAVCSKKNDKLRLHARLAWHAAAVTAVIYLSGWGPVLVGTFTFVALESVSHDGSRTWRVTALWSLAGVAVGQMLIWRGWAPSFLSDRQAQALGLMGALVLVFMIRMAGATMEEKENAEASMRASEKRFRSLVQHSSDTTLVIGEGNHLTYASPATLALLGREPDDVVGMSATELIHPDDRERVEGQLGSHLQSMSVTDPIQLRMAHADGSWRDAEAVVTNLSDEPSVAGFVANLRDISERKEAEALLVHQALHDPLTGLPNRTVIHDRAEQMLARARRTLEPTAALFIDLDNFKDINDTMGHEAGDELLRAVAKRFVAMLRESDTVGRLGGDEFVVLAEGVSIAAGPELVAQRLRDVLREPFRLEGYEDTPLVISASIGIAAGDRPSAQDLLRDADIALYRAKASGKDCWAMFEPEMQSEVFDRLELKMDLQEAIADGQFFLLYQPVFDLETVTTSGVEALLRWRHPIRGVVQPDQFIPMLEETGLIVEVGRWVLDQACNQAADWHRRGHTLSMSVNVSARQLETDVLLDDVRRALDSSGLTPGSLIIEVTETTLMRDVQATVGRLRALKELGVSIAIDDFGTGYSSLAYLQQFPVDALKIDRSFVAAMTNDAASAALIHTLVELGRALGLETLAEGIEDVDQLQRLRNEQCNQGQGFLISHPMEASAIEAGLPDVPSSTGPGRVSQT
jgi:diguanylate cyclase (GGDEF)-like protein/PAS domain S-box-containing protein